MPCLPAAIALGLLLQVQGSQPQAAARDSEAATEHGAGTLGGAGALGLAPGAEKALREALAIGDYRGAESLMLGWLRAAHGGGQQRSLLIELGGIYFLDHDPLQAAIAWNKANAIEPLPATIRFSLAMAYVQTGHRDWAERALKELQAAEPGNALFPFWLGRIAYDRQLYDSAIVYFREALALDPKLAKAHDNLGLALYDTNQVDGAMAEFKTAITLERDHAVRSPWPYLNLGIAYDFRGQTGEAMAAFQQAIDADARFAEAHYRLGNALLKLGRLDEAVMQEKAAATLDAGLAEPHLILSRIYRRQGLEAESQGEATAYQELHRKEKSPAAPPEER